MHGNTAARLLGAVLQTEQLRGICAARVAARAVVRRTTACIAKVGDVRGAAPLQAAIRSIVDKLGGLRGFSGSAPL